MLKNRSKDNTTTIIHHNEVYTHDDDYTFYNNLWVEYYWHWGRQPGYLEK